MAFAGSLFETRLSLREAALQRCAAFVPRAGRAYAAQRNYDRGPTDRSNVSTLSAAIRHRILTETELLTAVLERHSLGAAEKFVQEVFWRTYWKGWLESHPATWHRYRASVGDALTALDTRSSLRERYDAAVAGRTGVDVFDAFARELTATNYLHNHARMWFASMWIFTLELPWELGADFFLRQLLDGDPASNTLSWRWVAGLHTRGKTYLARPDNIRRYTGDRFALTARLSATAPAQTDAALPLVTLPRFAPLPDDGSPTVVLVHDDDLLGDLPALAADVRAVCAIRGAHGRSPGPLNPAVTAYSDAAGREATARLAQAYGARDGGLIADVEPDRIVAELMALAAECGARRIVAPYAPVGPVGDLIATIVPLLDAAGAEYRVFGRRYDALAWPAATRGFFNVRSRIEPLLSELGITAG